MTEIKKIGILTSGGDCAGLNAVVLAVVNSATKGLGSLWHTQRNGRADRGDAVV